MPGDFLLWVEVGDRAGPSRVDTDEGRQAEAETEFTSRRVSELKQIATTDASQQAQVVQVAETLKRDLNTIKQQLTEVNQDVASVDVAAAAKLVDQKSNEVIADLQATKAQLPAGTMEVVTDAQSAAADTGVKAIEVLAQQHQESEHGRPGIRCRASDPRPYEGGFGCDVGVASGRSSSSSLALQASTTIALVNVSSSATIVITSSTLPGLMDQVKDMTTQAFVLQKAKKTRWPRLRRLLRRKTCRLTDGLHDSRMRESAACQFRRARPRQRFRSCYRPQRRPPTACGTIQHTSERVGDAFVSRVVTYPGLAGCPSSARSS